VTVFPLDDCALGLDQVVPDHLLDIAGLKRRIRHFLHE
jgi:hypothetical protein